MSKRCSARTCSNSQVNNNTVKYFCYPKHAEFARQWALRAQREDLAEKPLMRVVKFYLCSDHFTSECFVDPPHKTKLVRHQRPYFIPLPSLFAPSLFHPCPTSDESPAKSPSGEPMMPAAMSPAFDMVDNMSYQTFDDAAELVPGLEDFIICHDDEDGFGIDEPSISIMHEFDAIIQNDPIGACFEDDDEVDTAKTDVLNAYDASDSKSFESVDDDEVNANMSVDTSLTSASSLFNGKQSDFQNRTCRLCAAFFEDPGTMIEIYAVDNIATGLVDDLDLLLPNVIQPFDGRPQQICTDCYTKTIECARIIRQFQDAQLAHN